MRCAYLELGEAWHRTPVVLTELDRPRTELRELAARLRSSPAFPRGANVNLCAVTGENRVRLLTFERGVEDFTLACGTGTGATVAALAGSALSAAAARRCRRTAACSASIWTAKT